MDKKNKQINTVKTVKQCVLIAQSLNSDISNANVFLPLNSIPAIQYTINWLSENAVQQVFIFYSQPIIQQYLQQNQTIFQKYLQTKLKIRSYFVKQQQLKGIGDIIRQVFIRNIINEDFLLMFADTITNINLSKLVSNHLKAKNQLKNVIMTTVMRNQKGKLLHVLNSNTQEILQIQNDDIQQFVLNKQKINLKKINIDIRRDISPAQIYMCTHQCVKNFKQNFQYSSMIDFINGTLTSQVADDKINTHILSKGQHSFRISKSSDYYLCYMHYITKNLYPYIIENTTNISIQKHKAGKSQNFTDPIVSNYNKIVKKGSTNILLDRTAKLSHNIFIGQDVKIGKNCQIIKSVIGDNCIIKDGCDIRYCIVRQGCKIGQNSKYQFCLIQKVQQSIKVHPFKQFVVDNTIDLIDRDIFLQTPENQQITLTEQLTNIMSGDVDKGIVDDLNYTRKQHNIKLDQFTMQMLKFVDPTGLQGAKKFSQKWGQIIKLLHDEKELQVIRSIVYSCLNIKKYEKAVHVFLQCFYGNNLISVENIGAWHNEYTKMEDKNQFTEKKCGQVLNVLKQNEQEDDDDDDDDDQQGQN